MRYMALVKGLNPHIEEEVTIEIEGNEFIGFASICPYEIEVGKSYPVIIGFTILDELFIHEINNEKKGLEQIGSSYQYYIRGHVHEDSIDAGITITDEDGDLLDYPEFIGKNIEMSVDRISIEFLKEQ